MLNLLKTGDTLMTSAYKSATENIEKAANYNKSNYDKKIHGNELKVIKF